MTLDEISMWNLEKYLLNDVDACSLNNMRFLRYIDGNCRHLENVYQQMRNWQNPNILKEKFYKKLFLVFGSLVIEVVIEIDIHINIYIYTKISMWNGNEKVVRHPYFNLKIVDDFKFSREYIHTPN